MELTKSLSRGETRRTRAVARQDALRTVVITDRSSMLRHEGELCALSERCNQPAAMTGLAARLAKERAGGKQPVLVMMREGERLCGAVLLFEYRPAGIPSGVLTTLDFDGLQSVVAAAGDRLRVSIAAAQAMLRSRARVLLISAAMAVEPAEEAWLGGHDPAVAAARWRTRHVPRRLRLGSSFEQMLSGLGSTTRKHLRYYRKQAELTLGARFVPQVPPVDYATVLRINRESLNPKEAGEFRRCWQHSRERDHFLCGLVDRDGRWLSYVGGRRQGDTAVIDWQANAAGHERLSLTTAMRAFHLHHEIERGTRWLQITGGTPHSMQHSFERHDVTDLLFERPGWRTRLMMRGAQSLYKRGDNQEQTNFLVAALMERDHWRSGGSGRTVPTTPVK